MEKLQQKCYFLKSTLVFEKVPDIVLDRRQMKSIILHSLQTLHGEIGAAIQVDIIKCECLPSTITATLRVPNRDLVKLWSALSLLGVYANTSCCFQINKLSASLMGLAVDSRHFKYER